MAKGILIVESHPASPDRVEEYNRWYDETHLPEVVSVPGIVAARRYAPVDGEGPFVAIYELEADDLSAVVPALTEAFANGRITMSDALQMDPLPVMRRLALTTSYEPTSQAARQ
jgi:hypothetical protein